jgi:uncharacterized protein YcgI (DUF1989 family)
MEIASGRLERHRVPARRGVAAKVSCGQVIEVINTSIVFSACPQDMIPVNDMKSADAHFTIA